MNAKTVKPVIVLNGPNLNLLGKREPETYGKKTLDEINKELGRTAEKRGFSLEFFQSNHEGELVEKIQEGIKNASGIIVNAGGYSHTSVAIRDALAAFPGPIFEVHISNTFAREDYRHHSYISEVATGVICGCGADGYHSALEALAKKLT